VSRLGEFGMSGCWCVGLVVALVVVGVVWMVSGVLICWLLGGAQWWICINYWGELIILFEGLVFVFGVV